METKLMKWGNSLGIRIPAEILSKTKIEKGDYINIEVSEMGIISLEKKRKERYQLKAAGKFTKYANPALINQEKSAFEEEMKRKYGKNTD